MPTAEMLQPIVSIGIHENMPFEQYLAIEAVNNSGLGLVKKSPRHYHERVELERNKPLVLGSLVHTGRLEALALAERYAVQPNFHLDKDNVTTDGTPSSSKGTKYVKQKSAEFREVNRGRETVEKAWYDEMVSIVSSIQQCRAAHEILTCSQYELTLVWEDSVTGLLCKARLDAVEPGSHFADLKTTARLDRFTAAIADYGYHRQMAHYQEGWRVLAKETLPPWLVPVESASPYCAQAAELDEETLYEGRIDRANLMTTLVHCMERDEWPGPPSPSAWRLPEWKLNSEPLELTTNGKKVRL